VLGQWFGDPGWREPSGEKGDTSVVTRLDCPESIVRNNAATGFAEFVEEEEK
jgi:hypothetical protein